MAYLILEDKEHEAEATEYSYFDFDPTNSEALEKIEAVFASGKAQSNEGKELLSQLCASSFERTGPDAEKNAIADRLKNMVRYLIKTKKGMSYRWRNKKNQAHNGPSRHLQANGRTAGVLFGS